MESTCAWTPLHLVTVRNCNVLIAAVCILSGAGLCTLLAMESGDRALRQVRSAGDAGVDRCFSTGEGNAAELAQEVLQQVTTRISAYAKRFTTVPVLVIRQFTAFIAAQPPQRSLDWEWQRQVLGPYMIATLRQLTPGGIFILGHMTAKQQLRLLFEADDTMGPPYDPYPTDYPSKFHDMQLITNNGTDYGPPCSGAGACRTVLGRVTNLTGDYFPGNGGYAPGYAPCETTLTVAEGRGYTQAACPLETLNPESEAYWMLTKLAVPLRLSGVGEPRWSALTGITTFSTYFLVDGYAHRDADPSLLSAGGGKLGATFLAAEISQVREFLRGIRVGDSSLRLFAVQASDWLHQASHGALGDSTARLLAGVSHGAGVGYFPAFDSIRGRISFFSAPLPDINATDPVIRAVARHARATNGTGYTTCCREHAMDYGLGSPRCPFSANGYNDGSEDVRPCSPELPAGGSDGYEYISRAPGGHLEISVTAECGDDPEGLLADIGAGCATAAYECAQRGAYCCDYDMSAGPAPDVPNYTAQISPRRFSAGTYPAGTAISDLCPASCGTCAGYQVQVEPYLVRVVRYEDGYGLDWWIVSALDRKYIYGAIEASTRHTKSMIQDANVRAAAEREEDRMLLALWVALISVALVIVAATFSHFVVRPLVILGTQMKHVAMMDMAAVAMDAPLSQLREVQQMQSDFRIMVDCIRKYREYLPQSVLHGLDEVEAEAATEVPSTLAATSEHSSAQDSRLNKSTVSLFLPRPQSAPRDSWTERSSGVEPLECEQVVERALRSGLVRKRVSFLASGFNGWHRTIGNLGDADLVAVHSEMLSAMLQTVLQSKGLVDSFSGDRTLVSFNAVRSVVTHKNAAAGTAVALLAAADQWLLHPDELLAKAKARRMTEPNGSFRSSPSWTKSGSPTKESSEVPAAAPFHTVPDLSVAVCTGDSRVGNMGCEGMKKFSSVTLTLPFTCAVERLAGGLGLGSLCDAAVAADAACFYTMRSIGSVLMPKRDSKPVNVHMLCSRMEASNDEWMYQLEQQEAKAGPWKTWAQAYEAVTQGDWEAAETHLRVLLATDPAALGGTGANPLQPPPLSPQRLPGAVNISPSLAASASVVEPSRRRGARAAELLAAWIAARAVPEPIQLGGY
eukprot:TRINITY_DN11913_c0_g1_i1.p1 TRINITY_DN11913_c0_g1~~TRINITY_DN11913_c0_g1_i1.p1  ORF type:complete len:1138 (+),score=282.94 TRINITY_DN11913_c0_g1_i1:101-3514(+)